MGVRHQDAQPKQVVVAPVAPLAEHLRRGSVLGIRTHFPFRHKPKEPSVPGASEVITVSEKAFETWKRSGVRFIAFPAHCGVYVMDEHGNNYGTYMSSDSFKKRADDPVGKGRLAMCLVNRVH